MHVVNKNRLVMSLALLLLPISALSNEPFRESDFDKMERIEIRGTTMGPIPYSVIVVKDEHTPDEKTLGLAVQAKLDQIDGLMSTYKAESDISRFNRSSSTNWIVVHPDTAKVVARAIEISRATDGAFDVTVGPAVSLWHFGPEKDKKFTVPGDGEIEEIKEFVGWKLLAVQLDPPAIKKSHPSVRLDLSAIAKGYAVDEVIKSLVRLDCKNALVEVGGEIYALGKAAPGKRWRVGVEKPKQGFDREIEQVAELENAAMATSGDYRNFHIFKGTRYSHSIDPTTCRPAKNDLATACVIAEDCISADAFATAVMVMGPDKGWGLCQELKMPLMIIERNMSDPLDSARFTKRVSSGFPIASESSPSPPKAGILPVFISATIVFALAILGMAAGAIFGRKPLQGTCGGLANMSAETGGGDCSVCKNPSSDCVETSR